MRMDYLFQFYLRASGRSPEQLLHQIVDHELPATGVEDRAKKLLRNFEIPSGRVANRLVVRHHSPSNVPNSASNEVFSCEIEDLD
jgi:hypothetical protein